MLNNKMTKIACVVALSILSGCNTSEKKVTFTILHTNDNHGRFWQNTDGEYGMAARKTLIDTIRSEVESEGGVTLVLSGGDINTGVPESDLQDAEPDFVGMNAIAYDAMAVGNHEFDNSRDVLEKQRGWANFPMLSANIYTTSDNTRYFDAYKTFDINGVSLALIGLTTDDTAKLSSPEYVSDLTFTTPQVETPKVIAEINAAGGADIIMAVTHMGHYANGLSGSNAPGDVELARSLPEGELDAIIGGHSQNPVCMEPGDYSTYADFSPGDDCIPDKQNGTYIMQAHEWGKYVGRADFEYEAGVLTLVNYELIPVNLKTTVLDSEGKETAEKVFVQDEIIQDPELLAELQVFQTIGEAGLNEKLATTDGILDGERSSVRFKQTNLGRLIATAQSDNVLADFGVMNSGGIRASIAAGDITYRDVLTVQPFGNTLGKATMTGSEVAAYLSVVATKTINTGAYAHIIDVNMTVDCSAGSVEINTIDVLDFDETAEYTFSISNYAAAGGDDYPVIDVLDAGTVDAVALADFFEREETIIASDYNPVGDITYINSTSTDGCAAVATVAQ